jgi:Nucleotidyltransferase substrate binding protein like
MSEAKIDLQPLNDLLRKSADAGLLADIDGWKRWRALRNLTSHTYIEARAVRLTDAFEASDSPFVVDLLEYSPAPVAWEERVLSESHHVAVSTP